MRPPLWLLARCTLHLSGQGCTRLCSQVLCRLEVGGRDSGKTRRAGRMLNEFEPPKSDALRALYWRSEILQVMYWLRGEGFGDQVDPGLLERFLGVDARLGVQYL